MTLRSCDRSSPTKTSSSAQWIPTRRLVEARFKAIEGDRTPTLKLRLTSCGPHLSSTTTSAFVVSTSSQLLLGRQSVTDHSTIQRSLTTTSASAHTATVRSTQTAPPHRLRTRRVISFSQRRRAQGSAHALHRSRAPSTESSSRFTMGVLFAIVESVIPVSLRLSARAMSSYRRVHLVQRSPHVTARTRPTDLPFLIERRWWSLHLVTPEECVGVNVVVQGDPL